MRGYILSLLMVILFSLAVALWLSPPAIRQQYLPFLPVSTQ